MTLIVAAAPDERTMLVGADQRLVTSAGRKNVNKVRLIGSGTGEVVIAVHGDFNLRRPTHRTQIAGWLTDWIAAHASLNGLLNVALALAHDLRSVQYGP